MRCLLILCMAVLASCAVKPEPEPEFSPYAARIASANSLYAALAAAGNTEEKDWSFSAVFTSEDRRLPLLILVRAGSAPVYRDTASGFCFGSGHGPEESTPIAETSSSSSDAKLGRYRNQLVYRDSSSGSQNLPPQETKQTPAAPTEFLEAMLLSETSIGLCGIRAERGAVTWRSALPAGQVEGLCERAGRALQRLLLEPQPDSHDRVTSPSVLERARGGATLVFRCAPGGELLEKQENIGETMRWRAEYARQASVAGIYVPHALRYGEPGWSLRLVRLPRNLEE